VTLVGVEFENMGQKDTDNAGLHFFYTNLEGGDRSIISHSSIHSCVGKCVRADTANNVEFNDNVIF